MAEYCNDKFLMVEDNEDSFRMWQGLVGPHYTPIVDNDGTLRWTNDGMLPNPDRVNIRGPQGAGLTIGGIRETAEELPAQAPPGVLWLVGTESPFESYSFIGGEWIDLGLCYVGPAGPPGPQGDDYSLTPADKSEIAAEAEQLLLNDLNNNPLPISRGGTSAQTLAGAKENLGIADLEEQIGDTPLATDAQDIRGAINELVGDLDGKVSKDGDTITGDLNLKTTLAAVGEDLGSQVIAPIFALKDKNGLTFAYIRGLFRTTGRNGVQFGATRGSTANAVALEVDADGTRNVSFSDPAPWRSALGLGSSGSLPITIAQGGSGQTEVITEETISNIADAASDCTITSAKYAQWGKVAMIEIAVKKTTAVTTDATTTLATIKSGKRPALRSVATILSGVNPVKCYIHNGGNVAVYGTITANQTITIVSTYLLP